MWRNITFITKIYTSRRKYLLQRLICKVSRRDIKENLAYRYNYVLISRPTCSSSDWQWLAPSKDCWFEYRYNYVLIVRPSSSYWQGGRPIRIVGSNPVVFIFISLHCCTYLAHICAVIYLMTVDCDVKQINKYCTYH